MQKGNLKDFGSGTLFLLIGLGFMTSSWTSLRIGTAIEMGPGYFPLVLGGILALFGLLIFLRGLRTVAEPIGSVSLRAIGATCGSIILFAVLVYPLGFVASTFITIFVASLAAPDSSPTYAAGLSVLLTAFCWAVFILGLELPLPLFPAWMI